MLRVKGLHPKYISTKFSGAIVYIILFPALQILLNFLCIPSIIYFMTNQNEKDIITQKIHMLFWSILWIIFRYSNFDNSF